MIKKRSSTAGKILLLAAVVIIAVILASCLPGTVQLQGGRPAGFFMGIWHGWIAPVSLIAGLFRPEIRIYEVVNTGWWYDFGFYIAIISGFGGISLVRKRIDTKM